MLAAFLVAVMKCLTEATEERKGWVLAHGVSGASAYYVRDGGGGVTRADHKAGVSLRSPQPHSFLLSMTPQPVGQ